VTCAQYILSRYVTSHTAHLTSNFQGANTVLSKLRYFKMSVEIHEQGKLSVNFSQLYEAGTMFESHPLNFVM